MIKIEAVQRGNGVVALILNSNDPDRDRDQMDLIGATIVTPSERRGRYTLQGSGRTVEILFQEPQNRKSGV